VELKLADRTVEVFTVFPRAKETVTYIDNLKLFTKLTEKYGFTGILLFVGNDTAIDPWLSTFTILSNSQTIKPLIAVNPVYMHPFTVARMISSIAHLFSRKLYLNFITGAAPDALKALGVTIEHDKRYERLKEYIQCVKHLISQSKPQSFQGEHYQIKHLQLNHSMSKKLQPEFMIAGHSDAARAVSESVGARNINMLKLDLYDSIRKGDGVHFGMIVRDKIEHAWDVANNYFKEESTGQAVLQFSMANTDSQWKQDLYESVKSNSISEDGYWLSPFENYQSDCPYMVRSSDDMTDLIVRLVESGTSAFIIEIPVDETEFIEIKKAFKNARIILNDIQNRK